MRRDESGHYSLHEVIRQYAYSHLEENEACCRQACDRHSAYYLNFAAEYESKAKAIYLDSMRHARQINSAPLMLMNLAGLAQLESRLSPDLAAGWLTLVLSHPAATRETKDRARQLLSEVEKRSGVEQIGVSRKKMSIQTLEELVETILE